MQHENKKKKENKQHGLIYAAAINVRCVVHINIRLRGLLSFIILVRGEIITNDN